jgi:hypothetical protein
VFGGHRGNKRKPLGDLYCLDCVTWTWTQVQQQQGAAPSARCHAAACASSDGAVMYVFGGWNGKRRCNELWAFAIATLRWTNLTSSAIDAHTSHSLCCVPPLRANSSLADGKNSSSSSSSSSSSGGGSGGGGGDRLLTVGRGETGTHKKFGCNIDWYAPRRQQWTTQLAGAIKSRAGHSCTVLLPAVSEALLFGGRDSHPVEFLSLLRRATAAEKDTNNSNTMK